ncbi:MAG: DUF4214 domain-containing protein [Iamia sp.]
MRSGHGIAGPRRRHRLVAVATAAVVALTLVGGATPSAATSSRALATGAAAAPGFGAPGTPVRPASERYVREAYGSILGRGADEPGLAYWGGRLDSGTPRGEFARQMVLSRESLTGHLQRAYVTAHHTPEPGELTSDIAAVRARRTTVESVLITLVSAPDYINGQGGGHPTGWVVALYRDVLGRTITEDSPEAMYWSSRVAGGGDLSNREVARLIVLSLERLRPVVTDAYDRVLGRVADASGRDFWANRIRAGKSILDIDRFFLASGEAWGMGCSVIEGSECLLPFPNDVFTLPDATTATGKRVVLKSPWVPAPDGGAPFDPTEWNRQDGFSPGSAIIVPSNGIDPAQSGLPPLTDIEASLAPDSPIVLVDLATEERIPVWAELDANAPSDDERALFIRPARNLLDGHTYAVGIAGVRDASGAAVTSPTTYQRCLDEAPHPYRRVREQCESTKLATAAAGDAGLDVGDAYLAWSFTVASTRNLAERAVHMRDEVLGGAAGLAAAPFTVTSATPRDDGTTRVDGTFEVPSYLTGDGAPGSRLNLGPDDLPEPNGTFTAPFTCTVPDSARTTPARPSLYGHGLLGTGGQANSGYTREFAVAHNLVLCGTDYVGMAEEDLPNTLGILSDLSRFSELVDRNQQGLLNTLVLGRLMTLPGGLGSAPAFQGDGGASVVTDTGGEVFYYGNSQGGINGGAVVALGTDIRRGVLGVPGMNYSTLLQRSVDFDPFFGLLANGYPSALDRTIMLSMIQMLWDRGEANGYANHMTSDPLPGSPPSEVLLHVAFGDHQVAQITADVMARTYGAATNDPPLTPGRVPDVTPLWGIDRIASYPYDGSALVYWDSGTPTPPTENVPNRAGEDPHGDPRYDPEAQLQMSDFLMPGGTVTDVCGGAPCMADHR